MTNQWNDRAVGQYSYRDQNYYTITPVPLYIEHRHWLLRKFQDLAESLPTSARRLLDFGCGDGYYARFFAELMPGLLVLGYDPALQMKQIATQFVRHKRVSFTSDLAEVPSAEQFDLLISVAELAHVANADMPGVMQLMSDACAEGATLLWLEQTAQMPRSGATWHRRSISYSEDTARRAGFTVLAHKTCTRPAFQALARPVNFLHALSRWVGAIVFARHISANPNHSALFRFLFMLSETATRAVDSRLRGSEGNTLFILRKGG